MLAERLPPEFTGSGRQAVFLGRALAANGVTTIGLCSSPNGIPLWDESWGFPILRFQTSPKEPRRALEFAAKSAFWLVRNRNLYDILHVHGYCVGGFLGGVIAKMLGKKTVYKITLPGEDDPRALLRSRFGWLKILLLNRFDAVIMVSRRVQRWIDRFSIRGPKFFTIPNGVDGKFYPDQSLDREARAELVRDYQLDKNAQIVSYVGSIEYRKGVDVLAQAWPKIISESPRSRLFLVGPFSERTSFYEQLKSLLADHLGKTVFLTGKVSDPERYYRASDVFVFPSRNESFGNALVEAMACGIACVATSIEGLTNEILIDGYNGLVAEQEDHEGFAAKVLSVLDNSQLKNNLALNAMKTVNERFRLDNIAKQYRELYSSLLNQG